LLLFFKKEALSFFLRARLGKKASASFLKKRSKKLLLIFIGVFGGGGGMQDEAAWWQHRFDRVAAAVARRTGYAAVFVGAAVLVLAWAVSGPLLHWSDTWQLVINTLSSIITFLMVFVIQNTQNRHTAAMQLKLDVLLRATGADARLIGAEALSESELDRLRALLLAERAQTVGQA
jgi:low affinity Fe/Cu permease